MVTPLSGTAVWIHLWMRKNYILCRPHKTHTKVARDRSFDRKSKLLTSFKLIHSLTYYYYVSIIHDGADNGIKIHKKGATRHSFSHRAFTRWRQVKRLRICTFRHASLFRGKQSTGLSRGFLVSVLLATVQLSCWHLISKLCHLGGLT